MRTLTNFGTSFLAAAVLAGCGGSSGGSSGLDDVATRDISANTVVVQSVDIAQPVVPVQSPDAGSEVTQSDTATSDQSLDIESSNDSPVVVSDESGSQVSSSDQIDSALNSVATCAGEVGPGSWSYNGVTSPSCDPHWRVCDADVGLGDSNSWQIYTDPRFNSNRMCVKACPDDEHFIPDPSFPGLGWDNLNSTACAVSNAEFPGRFIPVPLYLPENTPNSETFATPLAFYLYAGQGLWSCEAQTRQLSSDPFESTDQLIDLQFNANGELRYKTNLEPQWQDSRWGFAPKAGHDVLVIHDHTLGGNLRLNSRRMEIYNTTVSRLSCTNNSNTELMADYPESVEEIETAPAIQLDELLGMSLECQAFQRMAVHPQSASYGLLGYTSTDITDSEPRTINLSPITLDESYRSRDRYVFDDSGDNYSYSDGKFSGANSLVGDVSRTPYSDDVAFRRLSDSIIMTQYVHFGGGSGNSGTFTYELSTCETK